MKLVLAGLMIVCALGGGVAACGTGPGPGGGVGEPCPVSDEVIRTPLEGTRPPPQCRELRIVSVEPPATHPEGGDTATLELADACREEPRATFGGQPLTLTPVPHSFDLRFTFVVPPAPTLETEASVDLEVECDRDLGYDRFRNDTAAFAFRYDPDVRPPLVVADRQPIGTNVSVDAEVRVTFAEDMKAATIVDNVFIIDVDGVTTWDAATRTATFDPAEPLAPGTEYRVVVRGGRDGVQSAASVRGFDGGLSWTFVTD